MSAGDASRAQRRLQVHLLGVDGGGRRFFGMLVAGFFTFSSPAHAGAEPRPISLEEAVALAERNVPAVVQAMGQERASAAEVRSAWGAFLPSLSLNAGAVRQLPANGGESRIENGQVVELPTQAWSSSMGLGANLQLFGGGERFFSLRQARARQRMAGFSLVEQRYDTAFKVKQSFFDVLAARESAVAASAQLEQAEQQFRAAVARVRARTATRSDSLRADIQLRGARLAVIEAQNAIESTEASLTRAVGAEEPVTAAGGELPGEASVALSEAELHALAAVSPAVKNAAAALEAARAARQSAWSSYLPSLGASYSLSGSGAGSPFGDPSLAYSGSLHLSLSLPIFDGLKRESQLVQARVAEASAEVTVRDARLAATEGVVQGLAAFRAARARVESQTVTLAAAAEDLRVQQQRYAVGNSTLLDLLASQTQLDESRRDLIRARYDLRIAKAQLEAWVGRDL